MRLPSFGASSPASLSVGDGLQCAPLGFGTWSWGNKLLWGYDEAADDTLREAFGTAVGGLGNQKFFFDTGDSYGTGELEGRAESLLGSFRDGIARSDRCVIGTKLAVYPNRLTGASFEAACRSSLARMGRDQLEVVQAHWSAQNFQPWQEPALWDGLARCHEAGLARAVGTSNFGPQQLRKVNRYWSERGVPHTVNQVQLSLLSTLPIESGLLDECADLGVTPIGYSPLALGVLSGKYTLDSLPTGPRGFLFKRAPSPGPDPTPTPTVRLRIQACLRLARGLTPTVTSVTFTELLPSCKPLLGTQREIADARGVSMSAVAIAWAMSKGALTIVGMKSPQQVRGRLARRSASHRRCPLPHLASSFGTSLWYLPLAGA